MPGERRTWWLTSSAGIPETGQRRRLIADPVAVFSRGQTLVANRVVKRFLLGAAVASLLLTALPSTLPAWAAPSQRRLAAAPHRAFFPRITHRPSGARTPANRLSVFSSNDALVTQAPRSSSATPRLAPRLPAANPVVPATWTALGANPEQNEVSLCGSNHHIPDWVARAIRAPLLNCDPGDSQDCCKDLHIASPPFRLPPVDF